MIQLHEFDPVEFLDSEETIAAYLKLNEEAGEQAYSIALANVARARERNLLPPGQAGWVP